MHVKKVILVFLLWFAGLGAAAQFAKIAVPFDAVQAQYPHFDAELGWLLSLISLVGAVLGIVGGALVGGFGARRILLSGLVLGAAISFWQASLPSLPMMLISRVLEGLAHLAIVVAAPTLIAQLASDHYRGAAMTLWGTFFGVAFVLVAWLSEPLQAQGGLSLLFIAHGAAMLVIALLLAIGLANDGDDTAGRNGFGLSDVLSQLLAQHAISYRSPFISAPGIGWLFYTFTFVSLLTILPQLVPDHQSAWLAGLMPLVSIITSMIMVPVLLHFTSGINVTIIGLSSAMLVVVGALAGADLMLVGVALFAALGLVQGATFAAIPELNTSTETRALSYGVMAQTGNIGNLVGTPVLLAVLVGGGQAAMFAAAIGAYMLAIAAHIILHRRRNIQNR
ncbi:MAG: MFS transporter [Rhizobiaceae bacterium]